MTPLRAVKEIRRPFRATRENYPRMGNLRRETARSLSVGKGDAAVEAGARTAFVGGVRRTTRMGGSQRRAAGTGAPFRSSHGDARARHDSAASNGPTPGSGTASRSVTSTCPTRSRSSATPNAAAAPTVLPAGYRTGLVLARATNSHRSIPAQHHHEPALRALRNALARRPRRHPGVHVGEHALLHRACPSRGGRVVLRSSHDRKRASR